MQKELWGFLLGAIAVISVISTLNVLVVNNQRAEVASLQKQIAEQRAANLVLNASLTATNDRLTFLAQKVNPFIGAECRVDRVFVAPHDVPVNYTGYVFVETQYPGFSNIGIGVICR